MRQELQRLVGLSILTVPSLRDRPGLYAWLELVGDIVEAEFTGVINSLFQITIRGDAPNAAHVVQMFKLCIGKGWLRKRAHGSKSDSRFEFNRTARTQ